jgi:uncharacterized zinc-type alcohol dehydrogenase-like protein
MKVAVAGIGGLGHLAVQFASKMGVEVFAISTSDSKKEEASKLGATGFINSKKPEDLQKYQGYFDVILNTASGGSEAINTYMSMLSPAGTIVLIGLPDGSVSLNMIGTVIFQQSLTGSIVGSIQEVKDMFAFASKHKVEPWISVMDMKQCNEALKLVRENKAKYRIVLKN